MKLIYLTKWAVVALLLLPPFCFGQEPSRIEKSRIPAEADNIQKFVPAGWKIEAQVTGDLNGAVGRRRKCPQLVAHLQHLGAGVSRRIEVLGKGLIRSLNP